MDDISKSIDIVKEYYGKVLQSSNDLKTSACCSTESLSKVVRSTLSEIHPEVLARFYGCGSPIPPAVQGLTVLDLGCGTGRDAFVLSKLVGAEGKVIGVDMTAEQIAIGNRYQAYHCETFGYSKSNVEFRHGYIEDLESLDIASGSIDLVVSNCVINLSPQKKKVFKEILRVLKPGGELYFSDIFSDRRIPTELENDPILRGECLSGALYSEDFRRMINSLGIYDYRVVTSRPISIDDSAVYEKIGMVKFQSATLRLFNLELEDRCEDFGQTATYNGAIPEHPHSFNLDNHHNFEAGKAMRVCGNTADMLQFSRFNSYFNFHGSKKNHFGLFPCETKSISDQESISCC